MYFLRLQILKRLKIENIAKRTLKKSIILNWIRFQKLLAFWKEDRILKITVPLPITNSSCSGRNSTLSKISKIQIGGHDEKLKNFGQLKKKIGNLYELDNSKLKIFFEKKISKLR